MPCCFRPREPENVEKIVTVISEKEKKLIAEATLPQEAEAIRVSTIIDETPVEVPVDNEDAESTLSADCVDDIDNLETGEEFVPSTPQSVQSKPNFSPKTTINSVAALPVTESDKEEIRRDTPSTVECTEPDEEETEEAAAEQAAARQAAAEQAAAEKAAAEKAATEKAIAEKAARKAAKKAAAEKAAAEKAAAEKAAAEARAAEEAAKIAARDVIHGMKWDDEENVKLYEESMKLAMEMPDWQVAYRSEKKGEEAEVRYKISNEDGYKADVWSICVIPNNISEVMVAVLEVEAWTKWHPLCTKHQRSGPYDSSVSRSHYEQSVAWGAYKSDQNTVTHRWVNETKGYFMQTLRTLNEGEVGYVKPTYNREDVSGTVVCISVNPSSTIVIQRLNNTPPIRIPSMIEKFFMSTFLPKVIKSLYDNANNASNPKYPFQAAINKDETGIYALFDKIQKKDATRPMEIIQEYFAHLNIKMDGSFVAKAA